MLGPPSLFVFKALIAEGWEMAVRRHPEDHVPVVASRGEHFTCRGGLPSVCGHVTAGGSRPVALTFGGPSDNIDGLGVLAQSRQVVNFPVFSFPVHFPYLSVPSAWAHGCVRSARQ